MTRPIAPVLALLPRNYDSLPVGGCSFSSIRQICQTNQSGKRFLRESILGGAALQRCSARFVEMAASAAEVKLFAVRKFFRPPISE
jgi:hypothetical protein